MRYSFVGWLLLLLNGTVLAQTTVPFIFTAGTAAKASEVNADFQALATAIDNLVTRVNKLEGQITSADVAGTYVAMRLSVENSSTGSNSARVANLTEIGTGTVNIDGTWSGSGIKYGFGLGFAGSPLGVAPETPSSISRNDSGTWSLSGNILTISLANGSVSLTAAGSRLFIGMDTNLNTGSTLRLLIRTN